MTDCECKRTRIDIMFDWVDYEGIDREREKARIKPTKDKK